MIQNPFDCERMPSIDADMPPPFHDELLHACEEERAALEPITQPVRPGTQEDA